jgi:hypothetical protein
VLGHSTLATQDINNYSQAIKQPWTDKISAPLHLSAINHDKPDLQVPGLMAHVRENP